MVDYTLDPKGNRLTAAELTTAAVGGGASLARPVSYTYDALNGLTGATYTDGAPAESYMYDAAGNRLSATIGGITTTSTYDAANRLFTAGPDTYTYDANGNNRMASVTLAPGTNPISYTYNGDGVMVGRTTQGQTTTYLQDLAVGLPVILRETGPSGTTDYTWAKGLLSQQDGSGYYTALADGLGSVRALANSQGQVAGSFAYDSFGNPQGTPGGTATTNYHFAGEQTDPATGLINLRSRSYDSHAGRFVSRDTLVQGGSGTQALATAVLLFSIWRRRASLHWRRFCLDGRHSIAGNAGSKVADAPGPKTRRRPPPSYYPATEIWNAYEVAQEAGLLISF